MNKLLRAKFRVKIKSLAVEIRIIHDELKRAKASEKPSLQKHLDTIVKTEIRNTLVAYGFVRGLSYKQIEQSCRNPINAKKVQRIIKSLGSEESEYWALTKEVSVVELQAWLDS